MSRVSRPGAGGILTPPLPPPPPDPPQPLVLRETVRQIRAVGVQTLPSVTQLGFLVGMIAAMQMINLLAEFTGTAKVWHLLVLVIFREVAPLLTPLPVAG